MLTAHDLHKQVQHATLSHLLSAFEVATNRINFIKNNISCRRRAAGGRRRGFRRCKLTLQGRLRDLDCIRRFTQASPKTTRQSAIQQEASANVGAPTDPSSRANPFQRMARWLGCTWEEEICPWRLEQTDPPKPSVQ